jgi:hypothetical protein
MNLVGECRNKIILKVKMSKIILIFPKIAERRFFKKKFNSALLCRTCYQATVPVLNKKSPLAHMESELDVLGIHEKLVKYVVHLSKIKNKKNKNLSSRKLPKQQSTSFWSQGILGVNILPPSHCT